jgi:Co/Zn/Cd efflux system component
MASTFECSRNDVISNCGVLVAAVLVAWWASPWPDIVIGSAMALLFLRSAHAWRGMAERQLLIDAERIKADRERAERRAAELEAAVLPQPSVS